MSFTSQNAPTGCITIAGRSFPIIAMPILPNWHEIARAKGFEIAARIEDRLHLALRCHDCGGLTRAKLFTLRTANPICQPCLRAQHVATARKAGIDFLRRDPDNTQYAFYRLACGHEGRRQFGAVERAAAGIHDLRCAICLAAREAREAEAEGWQLLGPDPEADANYRLYRHHCGQEQRIARTNMQTGRFDCAGCGESWTQAPSTIYLMRFVLPGGEVILKLGHARNPHSRLHHQLLRDKELPAALLRRVPIAHGHRANRIEKRLHARLRRDFPDAVVPKARFAAHLRVSSEIYVEALGPHLHACLDAVAVREAAEAAKATTHSQNSAANPPPF